MSEPSTAPLMSVTLPGFEKSLARHNSGRASSRNRRP